MTISNIESPRQILENIALVMTGENGPEFNDVVADLYVRLLSLGQSFDYQRPNSEMVRELEELAEMIDSLQVESIDYSQEVKEAPSRLRRLAAGLSRELVDALRFAIHFAGILPILNRNPVSPSVFTDIPGLDEKLDEVSARIIEDAFRAGQIQLIRPGEIDSVRALLAEGEALACEISSDLAAASAELEGLPGAETPVE